MTLDRLAYNARRNHVRGVERGISRRLLERYLSLLRTQRHRARRGTFAAHVDRHQMLSMIVADFELGVAGGVDPDVQALHALAVRITLAARGAALVAAARERRDADVLLSRMLMTETAEIAIFKTRQILSDGVFDSQRARAINVIDEVFNEGGHGLMIADRVDHRDPLSRREAVWRRDHARE